MFLSKARFVRLNPYIGFALLAGSAALLAAGAPFMKIWFYSFAWWSFILALDGLNYRRSGSSLLFDTVPDFLFAAFISVPVWLLFELFNLRLRNWSYHHPQPGLAVRWLEYFIAFATVIPALKVLAVFFQGVFKDIKWKIGHLTVNPALLDLSAGIGILFFVLSLAWPRLFFPLIWLGFFFLLEPVNYRRQWPSFLRDLETGRASRTLSWLASGLAAGFLWELFNFWAGAHWEYHIPYLNFGRIFQMPVFGYAGFIPFALEIFAISSFMSAFYGKIKGKFVPRFAFWSGLLAFDLASFYLIDLITLVR